MSKKNKDEKIFGISNELLESKNVKLKAVVKNLSKQVEEINSTYLAEYKNKNKSITVNAILIGENCISIDTHWLLTTTKSGFRGIIMKFIQKLQENNGLEPKEPVEEPLEEQLVSEAILVTDCMKFVLSPTTYKKQDVWNEVFTEGFEDWENSLPRIDKNLTVGFAYKRVYDRFTQNDTGKDWLKKKASSITYYNAKTHKWETIEPTNGKQFNDGDFNHIKISKPQ